jgi:ABC-type Fe3+-hydroxamate transport system substrate-binding protein
MLSQQLKSMVPNIVVTHQMMPRDNLDLFRLFGGIFNKEQKAEAFCTEFEKALRDVSTTSRRMPERRVIMFVSKAPWTCISQNTYSSRVLDLVRWRTVGDDKRVRFPKIKITKSLLSKTDILLFSTSPFRFNQDDILDFFDEYDCASNSVSLIDGEMISWGGKRAIDGLQYLQKFAQELK